MWATVTILVVGLVSAIWLWSRKRFGIYRKYGVPEAPGYFPLGSSCNWKLMTGKVAFPSMYDDIYDSHKDAKVIGTYGVMGSLNLIVKDPEMIKTVMIKDFEYMVDRREFKFNDELLDSMLTVLNGEQWKEMRSIVSPIFTSGKLKAMLPLIDKVLLLFLVMLLGIETYAISCSTGWRRLCEAHWSVCGRRQRILS